MLYPSKIEMCTYLLSSSKSINGKPRVHLLSCIQCSIGGLTRRSSNQFGNGERKFLQRILEACSYHVNGAIFRIRKKSRPMIRTNKFLLISPCKYCFIKYPKDTISSHSSAYLQNRLPFISIVRGFHYWLVIQTPNYFPALATQSN